MVEHAYHARRPSRPETLRRIPEQPRHCAQYADAAAQCPGRSGDAGAAHDFRPVLLSLLAWGNRHFAPEGASVLLFDAKTGAVADPILVDRVTGHPITESDHVLFTGPAAPARTQLRYARKPRPPSKATHPAGKRGTT